MMNSDLVGLYPFLLDWIDGVETEGKVTKVVYNAKSGKGLLSISPLEHNPYHIVNWIYEDERKPTGVVLVPLHSYFPVKRGDKVKMKYRRIGDNNFLLESVTINGVILDMSKFGDLMYTFIPKPD